MIKIFFATLLIAILFCSSYFIINNKPSTETTQVEKITFNDNQKFKQEYESLNDGIRPEVIIPEYIDINYLEFDELKEKLEKGSGIIFFGFPTCPWCRHMLPNLFDAMNETNIKNIDYYNPKEIRNTITKNENGELITENPGTTEYSYILEKLHNILPEYKNLGDENIKRLYVPFVVIIKNGEITSHHLSTVESHTDSKTTMTNEQKEELKNIFIKMLEPLKNNNLLAPCELENKDNEPC